MPKNKGKGGKNRRRGKNENENEKRELVFKEDGQEYAQVTKMLGNGRLEAMCFDGAKRLCHIRGKLRKKVWINSGDIILLGLRDYQDTKADVILKYTPDEARNLKAYGELPESARINENPYDEADEDIEFQEFDGDDEDIDDLWGKWICEEDTKYKQLLFAVEHKNRHWKINLEYHKSAIYVADKFLKESFVFYSDLWHFVAMATYTCIYKVYGYLVARAVQYVLSLHTVL